MPSVWTAIKSVMDGKEECHAGYIADQVAERFPDIKRNSVSPELRRRLRMGELVQPEYGVYRLPKRGEDTTTFQKHIGRAATRKAYSVFAVRLMDLVQARFGGDMDEFINACLDMSDALTRDQVESVIEGGVDPGIGLLSVIAEVSDVSADWLLGIEKAPRPGIEGLRNLVGEAKGNYGSVELEESPPEAKFVGFTIGLPGQDQLTIDFVVRGRTERGAIPVAARGVGDDE